MLDDFKIIASILKLVPTDNLVTWCCSNKQQHKTCMTRFKLLGDILAILVMAEEQVAWLQHMFNSQLFSMKATGENEIGSVSHRENKHP